VQAIADLRLEEDAVARALKEIKARRRQLETEAVAVFETQGVSSINLPSGLRGELRTFMHANRAKETSAADLVQALFDLKLSHWLMLSAATVKADLKEKLRDELPGTGPEQVLPEVLRPMISVYEETRVVVVGAEGSKVDDGRESSDES
jgi:hypothetical protein